MPSPLREKLSLAMSIYNCPKGHESTESDYCSECGAKINGTPELASCANSLSSILPQTAQIAITCPDCTAPHDPDSGNFCEICGYNFATGMHGEVPPVSVNEAVAQSATLIPETSLNTQGEGERVSSLPCSLIPHCLELIITIDPSLRDSDSPPPPTDRLAIAFRLDKDINLIGRSSELKGIHPEIALDFDDAVSRRHALLIRQSDGTFVLRDIGSSNGTKLNGIELQSMVDTPIQDGDVFTLGHWTRIEVKAI